MKIDFFHKNPLFIKPAIVVVTLLVIVIPLKNTIALTIRYKHLLSTVKSYRRTARHRTDKKLNEKFLLEINPERKIFEEMSRACQEFKVVVKQVDLPKTVNESGVVVQTQEIVLQGDFINLLKSIHEATVALTPVKIVSIRFEREEDNKKINLSAHVIFQSVKMEGK